MGDRAQVHFTDTGAFLYTHFGGYKIDEVVASALDRGRSRWNDPEYLARIVFSEMIRDDIDGTTGYGIGTDRHSDVSRIVHVDCDEKEVTVDTRDEATTYTFDAFIDKHES